jgi:hypothetical protein
VLSDYVRIIYGINILAQSYICIILLSSLRLRSFRWPSPLSNNDIIVLQSAFLIPLVTNMKRVLPCCYISSVGDICKHNPNPQGNEKFPFTKQEECVRKDVECAFGVLHARRTEHGTNINCGRSWLLMSSCRTWLWSITVIVGPLVSTVEFKDILKKNSKFVIQVFINNSEIMLEHMCIHQENQ